MAAVKRSVALRASGTRRWPGGIVGSLCLLAFAVGGPIGAASAQTTTTSSPRGASSFVTSSGSGLAVNGQPWRFVGYNMPCAQPFLLDSGQLAYVFANIALNSGANTLRVWFFQQNGGPGNWAPFDAVIAAAKANGLRIIPTLVNEWPTCEPATASTEPRKTLAWYQTGYRAANDGYPIAFRDFALQVAAHYANEPTVAFWQLVNEAEAPTLLPNNQFTCDEASSAHALRAFGDDLAAGMHTVDHHHLVNLGTLGGDQCGIAGTDYAYVHAGSIDLCEYHDYGDPLSPLDTDQTDALSTRLQQCRSLPSGGKPFFVGESGIVNNVQPAPPEPAPGNGPAASLVSLQLRAKLFHDKITAAFQAGAAGYEVWFKGPAFDSTGDSFSIGDGDPTESMMQQISLVPPPTTIPETGALLLLPASAIVVLGGAVVWRRKRRRLRRG